MITRMRVGFCGSHGTGKTTTAKTLSKLINDSDWPVVPSTARLSKQSGFGINREATPESQLFTMMARTAMEDKIFRAKGRAISDRTPLDSLAYTKYQMQHIWDKERDLSFYWDMSYEHALSHMEKYDLVVFFPIYWKPSDDGIRDTDSGYQVAIEKIILELLTEMKIPTIGMFYEPAIERARKIKAFLTGVD